ncbi:MULTISPECIES: hypothetical protein [Enterobacterales]|uniref:hypothetical protein n=1 Tax=Enterobacterales TaxID=91347 RepID=UPI000847D9C0|nr:MULTISPECIES: hypothetical protein [Enterobacterales]MDM3558033.1 hypothetical protein [Proteus mirabilis]ODQ08307.1 hypothetical protein BGK50_12160 [Shigella sp. FC130]OEI90038.1 hypothetical protein BHE86_11150 [Shigella sp. FC1655]OEJ04489.1 hypothetical protein BHE89_07710 [Shigella sp. FC1967]
MAKKKIKAIPPQTSAKKISAGVTVNAPHTISFSFKYLDYQHDKFGFSEQNTNYFCKVIERLKNVSSHTAIELQSGRSPSLKAHCIDWSTTSEPKGFQNLNEQFQSFTPYQFAVSRNEHGRIHGFFIGDIFHIVWLDPSHQLYPSK